MVKYFFLLFSFSLICCSLPIEDPNTSEIETDKENTLTIDSQNVSVKQKDISLDVVDFGRQSFRLSHKINTTSNEILPILSKDGNTMYFSAMDRKGFFDYKLDFIKSKNCGGEDIFFSTLQKIGLRALRKLCC